MAFRNASKYRHTIGAITKKEQWFPDVKPTSASDFNTIAVGGAYIAYANSTAGTVGLLDVRNPGKRSGEPTTIHAHSAEITDLAFSPFSDHLLATASDDCSVKLWELPRELSGGSSGSNNVTLNGHKRRVESIKFHPSASNVAATSAGDKTVKLWDLSNGKEVLSLDGLHEDIVHSISWSWGGDLLATSSKDGKIRIIDPRAKSVVRSGEGHKGVKASRIVWLGPTDRLATTGFSKTRERQFGLHDSRDLSKPLHWTTLDNSTGILDLMYDVDAQLLVLAGKGDSSIRLYEINDSGSGKEAFQELTTVSSPDMHKSVASQPKRALDLMNTEVLRMFRLTQKEIVPVTYTVPRKSKTEFQEDLYPLSPSTQPALSSDDWFAGQNATPNLVQLKPTSNPNVWWQESSSAPSASTSSPAVSSPSVSSPAVSASSPSVEVKSAPAEEKKREEPVAAASTSSPAVSSPAVSSPAVSSPSVSHSASSPVTQKAVDNLTDSTKNIQVVRSSKYRHIAVKGTKPEACYSNIQTNFSAPHSSFLKANSTYFVVPWRGTGGQVAVIPFKRTGRQPDKVGLVECGSECLDFDFNPFDDSLLATVTESALLQLWKIPEGGYTSVERNPTTVLRGHTRRVTSVDFHPLVNNVVATSSFDFTVKLFDIAAEKERASVGDHEDAIISVGWNFDGSLMVTASKDRFLRIFDPRSNKLVSKVEAHDGAKGFKATWLGDRNQIVTVGHSKSSMRQVCLWDAKDLSKPLHLSEMDQGAGVVTPIFDPDTGVLYLSGKGDGNVKMYEINNEAPFVHFLTEYRSALPTLGLAPLPKKMCNVKTCEVASYLKLSGETVEQLHFNVPRTKMEFFQDDIFPPTRQVDKPVISADDWFSGKNAKPEFVSLKPAGMTPLSEVAKERKEKKYDFATERAREDTAFTKEKLMDRFFAQTGEYRETQGQKLKQELMEGTEDSEWD
eukprot:TRINITY_DN1329_c0_g1_i4.p1 TRINITY_DN1329_c0_g1~~TRINITY_DN1329_c0_g1_i4.p1  ORF type:complete len:956 (-),score=442.62 TRINITY_DN1329_c0_g1_i4:269-3136(-)